MQPETVADQRPLTKIKIEFGWTFALRPGDEAVSRKTTEGGSLGPGLAHSTGRAARRAEHLL